MVWNVNETGTVYTGEVTNNTGKDLWKCPPQRHLLEKADDIVGGMGNIINDIRQRRDQTL